MTEGLNYRLKFHGKHQDSLICGVILAKKPDMRNFFHWIHITGLIAIFAFLWLLKSVAVSFDFLNVFESTVSQFRVSDLYFSQVRDEGGIRIDTNIVVVNIGQLPRDGIALQIEAINRCQPAAIALDITFNGPKGDFIDSVFEQALAKVDNLVMVSHLRKPKPKEDGTVLWDSLGWSDHRFSRHATSAFANLITDEEGATQETAATVRYFSPKEQVLDTATGEYRTEYIMPVRLAQLVAPEKAEAFLERNNAIEHIYYKGRFNKFPFIDVFDAIDGNFSPDMVKGKIVLFGVFGEDFTNYAGAEDIFYTPLNPNPIGRTPPDMYGVVVHANILSMILDQRYLNVVPDYLSIIIAVILCYLNVVLFTKIYYSETFGTWYDVLTKGIQLVESILIVFILLMSIAWFNLVIDLTLALFAILLSGDVLEVFLSVSANLRERLSQRFPALR